MDFGNNQNRHGDSNNQMSNESSWWNPSIEVNKDNDEVNVGFEQKLELERKVVNKTMAWMCFALLLSALSAWFVGHSERAQMLLLTGYTPWIITGAELVLVFVLSGAIKKMAASTATLLFVIFSLLNGITLGVLFLCYTETSIFSVFGLSAGIFAAMALFGYTTKMDLTKYSSLFLFGLIGIVVVSLINLFLGSERLDFIISIFGVVLFVGLTAYDVQMIRKYAALATDEESTTKLAVFGALSLYLDFVNLFIYLLRLLGSRRN